MKKKDGGVTKFEGCKAGRKGFLAFDTEIFEVTPNFHMVELTKCGGDTLEYQKTVKQEMKPALKDIVWTWQGEAEAQSQPSPVSVLPLPAPALATRPGEP